MKKTLQQIIGVVLALLSVIGSWMIMMFTAGVIVLLVFRLPFLTDVPNNVDSAQKAFLVFFFYIILFLISWAISLSIKDKMSITVKTMFISNYILGGIIFLYFTLAFLIDYGIIFS